MPACPSRHPTAPPLRAELGRSTWLFLHKLAAVYPETPTETEKAEVCDPAEGCCCFFPLPFLSGCAHLLPAGGAPLPCRSLSAEQMLEFFRLFGKLYPCTECSGHFRLARSPHRGTPVSFSPPPLQFRLACSLACLLAHLLARLLACSLACLLARLLACSLAHLTSRCLAH